MLYTRYKVLELTEVNPIEVIGYKIHDKYLYKILLDPIPPRYPIYIYYGSEAGWIIRSQEDEILKNSYLIISTNNNWENIKFLNNPPINNSCYPIVKFREQLFRELGSLENPDLQIIDWYIASINNLY